MLCEGEKLYPLSDTVNIIQRDDCFKFGTDAVLLAEFANVKRYDKMIDLCTGTGIIPLLLSVSSECESITALEIQKNMYEMAEKSVRLNGLENRIKIVCGDLKNSAELFQAGSFDVVTCNPPYMINNSGKQNSRDTVTLSRHELLCTLTDVIKCSAYLLGSGGRFYMVHRAERLAEIMYLMKTYSLEPKRLKLISPRRGKEANLLLVEGQKDRNTGLKILPTHYMYGGK